MKVLFLTLLDFNSIKERGIYTDLLREFVKHRNQIYAISPVESRRGQKTHIINENNVTILKLKIGNIQKTNVVEKGISTLLIESQFIVAIKRYFSNVKFDLVIYSTPPITFGKAIEYVKNRDGAHTYLLLKDIFPQNSVDLGMIQKRGIKSVLYRYFRKKEKKLYEISDCIGCMSQANVDYVIKNNSEVNPNKVEICPNSVEVVDMSVDYDTRVEIREKYNIPLDSKVFIYGGNLGKPQGIEFLLQCLECKKNNDKIFFLIVGDGTEYDKLNFFINKTHQSNVKLLKRLPKDDYDKMVGACDIGMIFLDYRFTIPNFPSRLLSYMQAKIPVLAVTDKNTDIGRVVSEEGFGWWCESNSVEKFSNLIDKILLDEQHNTDAEFNYLKEMYSSEKSYQIITDSLSKMG